LRELMPDPVQAARVWDPAIGGDERARGVAAWRRAVDRTLNLVEPEPVAGRAA
jgi:hypothetical protein